MSGEIVKKIDKEFLNRGTREEFKSAICELLDLVRDQALCIQEIQQGHLDLQNQVRRLQGEKKSPSSSHRPKDLISRYPSNR